MIDSTTSNKMICPRCKIAMNHHCDKIVVNVPDFGSGQSMANGGVIQEFHSCSECGYAAARYQGVTTL
jgi:hypothetical protein